MAPGAVTIWTTKRDDVFTEHLPSTIRNPKRYFLNSVCDEEYYKKWSQSGTGNKIEMITARVHFSPSLFLGASISIVLKLLATSTEGREALIR